MKQSYFKANILMPCQVTASTLYRGDGQTFFGIYHFSSHLWKNSIFGMPWILPARLNKSNIIMRPEKYFMSFRPRARALVKGPKRGYFVVVVVAVVIGTF